ncbi:helix-turn-helix domain-containing protein [Knoellia locipacati]|uniref:helix-turn-helix domain-containing protein n=1 Tax=Knoellia locipacati TaxID=882824 RepID=UPI003850006D
MTVEQLATKSGISWRGLMYLEHGERNPRLLTLVDLASALEVEVASILPTTTRSGSDG